MQIIVRTGNDGTTSHFDGSMHGSSVVHGFTHSLFMQANRDGQSASTVHSTCGSGLQSTYGFPMYPSGHLQTGI